MPVISRQVYGRHFKLTEPFLTIISLTNVSSIRSRSSWNLRCCSRRESIAETVKIRKENTKRNLLDSCFQSESIEREEGRSPKFIGREKPRPFSARNFFALFAKLILAD